MPHEVRRVSLLNQVELVLIPEAPHAFWQFTEWFDDTMEYLGERYEGLTDQELNDLRQLGERYCQPVISRNEEQEETVGASS